MWKLKNKTGNRGFTPVELLVTIGIISALAGMSTIAIDKISSARGQTTCVNNLRAISQGLQMYYNDYMSFPDDGFPDDTTDAPLSTDLANYINDKTTFVCPDDSNTTSTGNFASYDPYYVARKSSYSCDELTIGCPRHKGAKNSTSAFVNGSTKIMSVSKVLDKNLQEIPPDGTTAQRTISSVGDMMTFDDGSTVTVDASSGSYSCFLVQSIRLSDGTLYSIVRVQDNGSIDVQVTPGSKFEVVTPSAIVGVRGTRFTVQTSSNGAKVGYETFVATSSGAVNVLDRETGDATILSASGTDSYSTGNVPLHLHEHTHANGEKHTHSHPSQNMAHHGKHDDEDSDD